MPGGVVSSAVARVRTAFLCNYASQETSGLISVIGAFVDTVYSPSLPIRHIFYLVASIEPDESEVGVDVEISLRLVRTSDSTVVLDARGQMRAERDPTGDPNAAPAGRAVVPIPAQFDEAGLYRFELRIADEPAWETPVFARLLDAGPA